MRTDDINTLIAKEKLKPQSNISSFPKVATDASFKLNLSNKSASFRATKEELDFNKMKTDEQQRKELALLIDKDVMMSEADANSYFESRMNRKNNGYDSGDYSP